MAQMLRAMVTELVKYIDDGICGDENGGVNDDGSNADDG